MNEPESKENNPQCQTRFSQEQYDMLKRCSDKKDMTEWNKWRKEHPNEDILLEGVDLSGLNLKGIYLNHGKFFDDGKNQEFPGRVYLDRSKLISIHLANSHLNNAFMADADLRWSHLEGSDIKGTHLEHSDMSNAHIETCYFEHAFLQGTNFEAAVTNGATRLWYCEVDRDTNFHGVALDGVRIDPATKQLLEYNIRRKNWEEWYKEHANLKWIVKPFWWVSDYGLSTGRIIACFFILAVLFASIYYLCGLIEPPGILDYLFVDGNGAMLVWWLVPIRAIHFSIVVMTVGFTNMHANAHSFWAHILVSLQMILGFVLLGALVTRFAVLFTAGGPAGKFADDKKPKATEHSEDTEKIDRI